MKWPAVLVLASLSVACGATSETAPPEPVAETPAADAPAPPAAREPAPQRRAAAAPAAPAMREVTLPAGTALSLELATALASNTSNVEDPVRATLREPVTIGGTTVFPAGTELVGNVTEVARSGRVKGRAKLGYKFTSLQHAGTRYEIDTEVVSHEAEATKSEDATKIGIGAGAGAVIGGILGGGDGAAKGAAIGGAAGTGTVLATRGKEVELMPGAAVSTTLSSPLRIRMKG